MRKIKTLRIGISAFLHLIMNIKSRERRRAATASENQKVSFDYEYCYGFIIDINNYFIKMLEFPFTKSYLFYIICAITI